MLEESREQSLKDLNFVRHPKIPFILIKNGKYFCIKHPKHIGMNAGAMQQHLRGKAHNTDSKTGNPINKIDFSEIIKELQNKVPIKSERELFDDYYHIVTKLCALKDRTQAMIIVNHTLEGRKRMDVYKHLFLLNLNEIKQAEIEKKKAEDEKKKAESDKFMAELVEARDIRTRIKLGIRA